MTKVFDEINGGGRVVFAFDAQSVYAPQANGEEHRIMVGFQPIKGEITPKHLARLNGDAADFQEPSDLARGKVVGRFIGGDPVFVQTACLCATVIEGDIVAFHGKSVRTGQTRRPCPDNSDGLAREGGAGERMHPLGHQRIGRITLKLTDDDGLAFGLFAHAGLFAERLCRADTGAHAAKDILRQDRFRSRLGRARLDLTNKQRNIDRRRTGRHTRRIVTEITAVGSNAGLMRIERRMEVFKVPRKRVG